MNQLKLISVSMLIVLTLTACVKDPYTIDVSYLPPATQEMHQKLIQENLAKYNSATDATAAAEKSKLAEEIGFHYMTLGNYTEAIKYYEKVLDFDKVHFVALNNLAYMYETAGKLDKALEYQKRLYEANNTNKSVVEDVIRILVENGRFSDAQGVLEAFSKYDKSSGVNYTKFISDQFTYISSEKTKKQAK